MKANNVWKYWANSISSGLRNWNRLGITTNWSSGQGSIGYGDNDDNTTIAAAPSILVRREFVVADVDDITHLMFHAVTTTALLHTSMVSKSCARKISVLHPLFNEFTSWDHEAVLYSGGIPDPFSWMPSK